jgi:hypothetical protein
MKFDLTRRRSRRGGVTKKRIRLTRSLLVNGEHAAAGSVHDLAEPVADDLIGADSAVPVRSVWWVVAACLVLGVGVLLVWGAVRGWR